MEGGTATDWRLVRSTAGRDKDQYYLVLRVQDDGFVLLVDGDRRRAENPKRKNIKHLEVMPVLAEGLVAKTGAAGRVTGADVRRALAELVAGLERSGSADRERE